MNPEVEQAVADLIELVRDELGFDFTQIIIDHSASSKSPFRVVVPDEQYPLIGEASVEELS